MNIRFVRALACFIAFYAAVVGGSAHAATQSPVIDVTGLQSAGEFGDPGNSIIELNLGALATVTTISWDFSITANPPSLNVRPENPFQP